MRAYGIGFMNGSINSLESALANAARIAGSKQLPVVMIYMAQDLAYPRSQGDYQATERAAMTSLLEATKDVETTWIGHSWSGHIVLGQAKNYPSANVALRSSPKTSAPSPCRSSRSTWARRPSSRPRWAEVVVITRRA